MRPTAAQPRHRTIRRGPTKTRAATPQNERHGRTIPRQGVSDTPIYVAAQIITHAEVAHVNNALSRAITEQLCPPWRLDDLDIRALPRQQYAQAAVRALPIDVSPKGGTSMCRRSCPGARACRSPSDSVRCGRSTTTSRLRPNPASGANHRLYRRSRAARTKSLAGQRNRTTHQLAETPCGIRRSGRALPRRPQPRGTGDRRRGPGP